MTTRRQIHKLLRPYQERGDLLVSRHEVYLLPIYHVVRGFSIYRTGEADRFDIALFVGPSFVPTNESPRAVSQIKRYENWLPSWTQPDLQQRFEDVIREYALPSLKQIDLQTFLPRSDARWHGPESLFEDAFEMAHMRAFIHTAHGDFEPAAASLEVLAQIPRGHRVMEPVLRVLLDDLQPLLLANDRAAAAALLHTWEGEAINRWKLSEYWRPSPFPLELQPQP
ncbi:hypothetical protein [Bosea sp. BH3]|uniref:hypothetical protein n=1 Tax=Bosea sp. BH3 TaxID=2871701 RepID=UPI0021CB2C0B|nr:hypothetical protein [Bosea sp. BH3]MCU4178819.1 hypothetical protein [Bosea sp. BH3]